MKVCVTEGCGRQAHYRDGRCKPCWRREVWGPANAEIERAKARERRATWRQARRERLAAAPPYFTPPS